MRKQRKCGILLLMFTILAAAVLPGCGKTSGSGVLKVGVRDDIVNFSYFNEKTGKYYGLEVDLAYRLAEELGYAEVEFTTVQPDTRKEVLLNGDVDCLIATYSIADTRKENFDFSEPYYTDTTAVMVEESSMFDNIEDLADQNIGILAGANAGPLLAAKLFELGMITDQVIENTDTYTLYEGMHVTKAESYSELSTALEEGSIDAVCMDKCLAETYMNDNRKLLDISIAEQQYGVATQKDSKLSKPVADAIQKMLDDGTINELIDKWD